MASRPARIDFFYFDAGGGHRAAATALEEVIARQQRPWRVRLVNLNDVLLPIDIFRRATGYGLEDLYNLMLRRGWTIVARPLLPLMHAAIRRYHPAQVRLLRRFWEAEPPDLAVSVIPNFNRALCEALRAVDPRTPFVTIPTDLADYPPHVWFEPQPQHLICGTARAVEQALAMGHARDRVFQVSGMILRPRFYEAPAVDRAAERRRLGLDPDRPTGLVLFGGHGSPAMLAIARRLQACRRPLQLILLAGHNRKLAARLRALAARIPMHVEGFTGEVPYFMRLADFFIGKPGPGSISEALAMRLPVVVERNLATLPQERYNADWIIEQRVGVVVGGFGEILPAVERLLEPGALESYRARVAAIDNRAVFEIPDLLQTILDRR